MNHAFVTAILAACLIHGSTLPGDAGTAATAEPSAGNAITRAAVLAKLRPSVLKLLNEVESKTGLQAVFRPTAPGTYVVAQYFFDPRTNTPTISLGKGWEDVDVAHELTHMKMELLDGYRVLAWRRDVTHSKETEAAFGRVRCYVDDQVVHVLLARAGYKVDGEVLKPPLFDSIYTKVPRYLNENRPPRDDGMAHLDPLGHGDLCRAAFLVQAELLPKLFGETLPPERLKLAKEFAAAFRQHRPKEAEKADKILALFQKYDVMTLAGHESILKEWSEMEGLDRFVGISSYKRENGKYVLPWP
ncbi:MAG: hypothetical protein NTW87_20310 [Planctomycetota bacterium]|nr:hypothetical protein [Planctomycetota bacterium]